MNRSIYKALASVSYIVALGVVCAAAYGIAFGGVTFGLYDILPVTLLLGINFLLWLVAFSLVIFDKQKNRLLYWLVNGMTAVALLVVAILVVGFVQDVLGTRCVGFLACPKRVSKAGDLA